MLTGFLAGLVFPGASLLLSHLLYKDVILLNKPAIPYLAALGLNLFFIRISYKKDADQTGKGIMLATFVCMLLLIFIFKIKLT